MVLKIYLSGKMTGIENYNYNKFNLVAKALRESGCNVINPAEMNSEVDWEWKDFMKEAIKMMMDADVLFVLNGYETSIGANVEIELAEKLGIGVVYQSDFERELEAFSTTYKGIIQYFNVGNQEELERFLKDNPDDLKTVRLNEFLESLVYSLET